MTTAKKLTCRKVLTRPAAYGISSTLVLGIHPSGQLSIREHGRHESSAVYFDLSELYCMGVKRRIAAEKKAKRKKLK